MEKGVKIVLALLLLLCLADMPYGYYQLVRFLGFVGFSFLAYQAIQQGKEAESIVCAALALLFQPFFKLALGRGLWNVVDVVVAIGLVVTVFQSKAERK